MWVDLPRYWYRQSLHPVTILLLPFSWLFGWCAALRRKLYRTGVLASHRFPVPVLVVGNITVGGTGKTPFVIWLANFLRANGYRPGIVSRGAGGQKHVTPYLVRTHDVPATVGDEALLLVNRTNCPVVIGLNRAEAVRELLKQSHSNLVISDDGMQHYRMARDIEIALIDAERRLGNQQFLPAGPLREPPSRLNDVDMVVVKDGNQEDQWTVSMVPLQFIAVNNHEIKLNLQAFADKKVHAVAGIAYPEKFFSMLKELGMEVIPHVFPDHYVYNAQDLLFEDDLPIIMTEKDAVKCRRFVGQHRWYVEVELETSQAFQQKLLKLLSAVNKT